jgi:hypothetical protein
MFLTRTQSEEELENARSLALEAEAAVAREQQRAKDAESEPRMVHFTAAPRSFVTHCRQVVPKMPSAPAGPESTPSCTPPDRQLRRRLCVMSAAPT